MTNNPQATIPDRIFAGFVGGGRFWGEVTPETHPDNTQYIRADLASDPTDRLSEAEVQKAVAELKESASRLQTMGDSEEGVTAAYWCIQRAIYALTPTKESDDGK